MAKRTYTPDQQNAIDTRDKTLLVSAAAGSGKTATLIERIAQSILDKEKPESIANMLIVTFTNAAVKELRDRVSARLAEALAEDKQNEYLERQLHLLPGAKICTIDAFCNEVFKNNAERFGISPSYRIADPTEAKLLTKNLLGALINSTYDGEEYEDIGSAEDFESLATALTGVKNESGLEDIFDSLYENTKSIVEGASIFTRFAEYYEKAATEPLENNRYADYSIKRVNEAARHFSLLYKEIKKDLNLGTDAEMKYIQLIDEEEELLLKLATVKGYNQTKELLERELKNLPSTSEDQKTDAMREFAQIRTEMKEAIFKNCYGKFFTYTEEEYRAHLELLAKKISLLARFLLKFDRIYFEEKKRRAMLEYSDIERLTYESLYNKDGSLTELAESIRDTFSSVYIDEYQDVNALQSSIFDAISKEDNRFMVGDIKQSIYGFRSAKPEIFAKMKSLFPLLEKSEGSKNASIFMSQNFRCDKGIIDFSNEIFDLAFDLVKESIGYVTQDRLEYAKKQECGEPPYRTPEIALFDRGASTEEDESAADLTPRWVANKIKYLIENETKNDGSPIRPSDIAIVLRKDMGRCKAYADALMEIGVDALLPEDKDFFLNAEIQLVLSLLNAIDNPGRDIHLGAIMLSPLFNFTADELYFIKKSARDKTLWQALEIYTAANPDFSKGISFINTITRYRAIAEGMAVDALILRLYSETGLMALASNGTSRENLMLLYNYAKQFESSSFEGLYSFISYVNTVIESGATFSTKKGGESEGVTIITVHKSKGLEYPIVFLGDAAKQLASQKDRAARVSYNENFGAAFKLRTESALALVESPIHNAIIEYTSDRTLEEEFRVYYVALTRARERLYLAAAVSKNSSQEYLEGIARSRKVITPYSLREMKTFVDTALIALKNPVLIINDTEAISKVSKTDTQTAQISPEIQKNEGVTTLPVANFTQKTEETAKNIYTERFLYEYHAKHLAELPEKLSISKLHPTVLDGTDAPELLTIDTEEKSERRKGTLPEFITGTKADESARRGIATHNFLQFFDIEYFDSHSAKEELDRLVAHGFISEENSKRVRLGEIELFRKSELYESMKKAKKLHRELRFNVMLPAAHFTADEKRKAALGEKKILLQGVIDCIIEDSDGNLHLVDYKTDRLTREELSDKSLAQKALAEKHSVQLNYYALAIERIFGKLPKSRRVYSLPLGDTVDINQM